MTPRSARVFDVEAKRFTGKVNDAIFQRCSMGVRSDTATSNVTTLVTHSLPERYTLGEYEHGEEFHCFSDVEPRWGIFIALQPRPTQRPHR